MYHLHFVDEVHQQIGGKLSVAHEAMEYNTVYRMQNGVYASRGMLARSLYKEGRYVPVASADLPPTEEGRDALFRMTSPSAGVPAWPAMPVLALTVHSPYGHYARPSGVGDIVEAIDKNRRVRGRWVRDFPKGWLEIAERQHEPVPSLLLQATVQP